MSTQPISGKKAKYDLEELGGILSNLASNPNADVETKELIEKIRELLELAKKNKGLLKGSKDSKFLGELLDKLLAKTNDSQLKAELLDYKAAYGYNSETPN